MMSWFENSLLSWFFCGAKLSVVSDLLPTKVKLSEMISVEYFSIPSLSCHFLVCNLPSTDNCCPFRTYCPIVSAGLLKNTTLCHSVLSS